jgi:hypothetical protein
MYYCEPITYLGDLNDFTAATKADHNFVTDLLAYNFCPCPHTDSSIGLQGPGVGQDAPSDCVPDFGFSAVVRGQSRQKSKLAQGCGMVGISDNSWVRRRRRTASRPRWAQL